MDLDVRRTTLEQHGRTYGELRLAIGWTDDVRGDGAKACTAREHSPRNWKRSLRLADAEHGAALLAGRGERRNPFVALGASGLIGADLDGELGLQCFKSLGLEWPNTVTVETPGGGVHLWYYPPAGAPPEVVKVEFKKTGDVMVSADGYFIVPPALHPGAKPYADENRRPYAFRAGRAPWEIEIATLPLATVLAVQKLKPAPAELIPEGDLAEGERWPHLRRIAYVMRRYSGASRAAMEAAVLAENAARCKPPHTEQRCKNLARDTYKRIEPKTSSDREVLRP
jgi:hypothetical protein